MAKPLTVACIALHIVWMTVRRPFDGVRFSRNAEAGFAEAACCICRSPRIAWSRFVAALEVGLWNSLYLTATLCTLRVLSLPAANQSRC